MAPNLDEITAILERTPATLRAWLSDLPTAWLDTNEGEGTFSPRDVLGHLIHGEKTDWMPRVHRILESGESVPFDPFDREGFRNAPGVSLSDLLDDFEHRRAANLVALRKLSLTSDQLSLKGTHPALGAVTLGQLLATWAVHDLNHLGQIARVMSRRYTATVGPWKEYLGILNRQ
jgi:uncharacterized damage-inducible protein DinB